MISNHFPAHTTKTKSQTKIMNTTQITNTTKIMNTTFQKIDLVATVSFQKFIPKVI